MEKLLIVKIGANVIDDAVMLDRFLADLSAVTGHRILVHGGGKLATQLSTRLGIPTQMVEGRRITDEETLRVVTMTYAGWINKSLASTLTAKGCTAIGLCGADVKLIPALKRPVKDIDYGHVGDLLTDQVNTPFITKLLVAGITPVIAPIASDAHGQLLNVNADTVAQSLAEALSALYETTLVYCFEKKGILTDVNDNTSMVPEINEATASSMKADGTISAGMIPKIDNALRAISNGVSAVVIGHAGDITMIAKNEKGYGTHIIA